MNRLPIAISIRAARALLIALILVLMATCRPNGFEFNSHSFQLQLNRSGNILSLQDTDTGTDYLVGEEPVPVLSIRVNRELETPDRLSLNRSDGNLQLHFKKNRTTAVLKVEEMETHITFELHSISGPNDIELILWGPFPTSISETIGETVGVVRNDRFAIGIQALNIHTLGGYPTHENDRDPSYNIFDDEPTDTAEDLKILYRGQTARHAPFGSVLQAYSRNRNKNRVIPNWGHEQYQVPSFDDGGVVGSKIALFGCSPERVLDTLSAIEISEGLPHPEIDGIWGKRAPGATAAYLIVDFSEESLDQALNLTERAGLKYLYHGSPFQTWGHFLLKPTMFPDNWESLKRCVEKASQRGIHIGIHTLSNFITTNDPYVTPVPDSRLAKVGWTKLSKDIKIDSSEIAVADPTYFRQFENNTLRAAVIGSEIIRYRDVSTAEPWRLLRCERGAFGTGAATHKTGTVIAKLMDHPYKTFLTNNELQDEVATTIAQLFNETGLRQISFDGLEGTWSSGQGQYARQRFVHTWYEKLKPELKGRVITDASNPGHFFWHMFTRMNWGEPWYAGFRESQTRYRLLNQDYFSRNLIPPMLGWFKMSAHTSLEDIEWLLARSAGFGAGYSLVTSYDVIENNGLSDSILSAVSNWESARMAAAFNEKQREKLRQINREFRLVLHEEGGRSLFEATVQRFVHSQSSRQPGEPESVTYDLENPNHNQTLQFTISLPADASVSNLSMEIDNFPTGLSRFSSGPGWILQYRGGDEILVYDGNWNRRESIKVEPQQFTVSRGYHRLSIDCRFSGADSPQLKVECRTWNRGEKIGDEIR